MKKKPPIIIKLLVNYIIVMEQKKELIQGTNVLHKLDIRLAFTFLV